MIMRTGHGVLCFLLAGACVQGFDGGTPERGPLGKGDATGSCRASDGSDYCGGQSDGTCWCNDSCVEYGDCCSDFQSTCSGPPPSANPLAYRSYKVLFTNPICGPYQYPQPVTSVDGSETITTKPVNVYCQPSDSATSGSRPTSPQYNLLEWIRGLGAGEEIFLAFLSFSNRALGTELCAAIDRGAKVTFVLDAPTDRSRELEECGGTVLTRGHAGGIGYAHNKLVVINPSAAGASDADPGYMRMAFGSGNASSGLVLHHENWHFIDVARDSYFAEAHRCLMAAQLDNEASSSKSSYRDFLDECRGKIPYAKESDINAFFVPAAGDSDQAVQALVDGIREASSVDMAAHRFAFTTMIDELAARLADDPSFRARLVADDDLYWLKPMGGGEGSQVGDNQSFEAWNVSRLLKKGANGAFAVRYLETNHGAHLLQHNKFLIFQGRSSGRPDGVLCGAANLTGTGFYENFENIYLVEIPEVVAAYKAQYRRFWDGEKASPDEPAPPVATPPGKMPATNVVL